MPVIDFHTHIFPDEIARKTVKKMAEEARAALHAPGTLDGLLERMAACGIDYSVTQPVATRPEQVESINNWVNSHRNQKIIPFGAIHPDYPQVVDELTRLHRLGFKGIKLHPDYQAFYPGEERLDPVYRTCADLGLIILFHSGDDIGHPRPGHSLPRLLAKVHERYADLRLVYAHMGGYEMWDQAEQYLAGRDVYLDTSYTFPFLPKDRVMAIIARHGAEKILLGSDSPWGDPASDIAHIESLDVSRADKDRILGINAAELLGLTFDSI
ncbi:MAG: amidohydrolase [Spirochaetales bacterium]|nr:amidohydrolase [Spirochaetales bacterium]